MAQDALIYTFYSYKGGVGRSMALANIAELFYLAGFNVLAVDWDLEAPGLDRFFLGNPEQAASHLGLMDMLEDYKRNMLLSERDEADDSLANPVFPFVTLKPYCIDTRPYLQHEPGPRLMLMTAGKRDGEQFRKYAQSVLAFNWKDFYEQWEGELFFEWLRREFTTIADVVLIDSRTGVTEMGGVCTYQLADVIVMFCTATQQSMRGTYEMITNFKKPQLLADRNDRPLEIMIVPARVDKADSTMVDHFQQEFLDLFKPFTLPQLGNNPRQFWNLNIPYVPKYAFKESVAIRESSLASAEDIVSAFIDLAKALVTLLPDQEAQSRFVNYINAALDGTVTTRKLISLRANAIITAIEEAKEQSQIARTAADKADAAATTAKQQCEVAIAAATLSEAKIASDKTAVAAAEAEQQSFVATAAATAAGEAAARAATPEATAAADAAKQQQARAIRAAEKAEQQRHRAIEAATESDTITSGDNVAVEPAKIEDRTHFSVAQMITRLFAATVVLTVPRFIVMVIVLSFLLASWLIPSDRALPIATPTILLPSLTPVSTTTPMLDATQTAAVAATLRAQPSSTPTPTLVPPTNTPLPPTNTSVPVTPTETLALLVPTNTSVLPTNTPVTIFGTVQTNDGRPLNVRGQPSTQAETLKIINNGTAVTAIGICHVLNGEDWLEVLTQEITGPGWVIASAILPANPIGALPIVPTQNCQ